jgi:branched-chain amino acid transport system ATP-binding protein
MAETITTPKGQTTLEVKEVDLWFGGTHALDKVSFDIKAGEVFGIIGPNGAGKSSLLNCINGYYKPRSGSIVFNGKDLTGIRAHRVAQMGIGRTFQNIELSADSTVIENVMLGRHLLIGSNSVSEILQLPGARRQEVLSRQRAGEILELVGLADHRDDPVSDLPYGRQKLVELGRALATDPQLLLLDEPTAGMTREERHEVAMQLRKLAQTTDITLVLIEHDTGFIRALSDRIAVLDFGRIIALGDPSEVMADPKVVEAYLGASESVVEQLLEGIAD